MKRLVFLLALLLVLTALPLGVSAIDDPPPPPPPPSPLVVTASTPDTVPVGTKVVLTASLIGIYSAGTTPAGEYLLQWYIGDPADYTFTGQLTPASCQPIPGANEQTYEPDTSVPGVTSYFCVMSSITSNAFVLTVVDKTREFGYVPDDNAPGFEKPDETPAPAPDADANPNTGVFVQGRPHFGLERAR